MNALEKIEQQQMKKDLPSFRAGDTVRVHVKIKEGDKERIQVFSGTVIARRGHGINKTFTVRRIVDNEGVERIFPLHSPNIVDIRTTQSGKSRRAKLYYLRQRTGRAVKLAHRHSKHALGQDDAKPQA